MVVTGPDDPAAAALASVWPGVVARMDAADLSDPGWRLYLGDPRSSVLSIGGNVVPAREVAGVVTRMGWILPDHLIWIHPEDREFVAAEMTAFALAFFDALDCPVLNRPTPACLAGPVLRPRAWRAAGAQAGFALAPPEAEATHAIQVIGDFCIGAGGALANCARALASDVGASLLDVQLAGAADAPQFLAAHAWPDLAAPGVAAALAETIRARQAGGRR